MHSLIYDQTGISEERIINAIENEKLLKRLTCGICLNILWKPVSCSQCQINFCESCITIWLNKSPAKCPNRCTTTFKKMKVSPVLNDLLSEFSIKCQFANKGCEQILGYDQLEKHEKACNYKETPCKGCGKLIFIDKLMKHEDSCELVKMACDSCVDVFSRVDIKNHRGDCWKSKYMSLMKICDELKEENKKLSQKDEGEKNNQIICPKQHKMESKVPSERIYRSSKFGCALCRKIFDNEKSWHCSVCKYDICYNCRKPV